MSTAKNDYGSLEREYVEGDMSIRALCRDHDIKSWSAVSTYAKKHSWQEKREDFRNKLATRQTEAVTKKMAEGRAEKVAQALDDAIMVSNKVIWRFLDMIEDRWIENPKTGEMHFVPGMPIPAADFVKVVDKIMVLNGQPTKREAHLGLNLSGELTPENTPVELLRDVVSIARERGITSGPTGGSSPLPRIEGARKVN